MPAVSFNINFNQVKRTYVKKNQAPLMTDCLLRDEGTGYLEYRPLRFSIELFWKLMKQLSMFHLIQISHKNHRFFPQNYLVANDAAS